MYINKEIYTILTSLSSDNTTLTELVEKTSIPEERLIKLLHLLENNDLIDHSYQNDYGAITNQSTFSISLEGQLALQEYEERQKLNGVQTQAKRAAVISCILTLLGLIITVLLDKI